MEDWLSVWSNIAGIIGTLLALIGAAYSTWLWIVSPIKKHLKQVDNNFKKIDSITQVIAALDKKINDTVLPVINSISSEFSKNGGKSIKDRIQRIDDLVTLSELRSKMIASNLITTGAYECDIHGSITWVNKALCEMYGLSFNDMLGNGWLIAVRNEDRQDIYNEWIGYVQHNIPYEADYVIVNQKTGENIPVKTTAMSHKSIDGKVLGFYGTVIKNPKLPVS